MTWKYDMADDGSSMDIIDHDENVVKTLQNDGNGFMLPDDILEAMRSELKNEFGNNGNAFQSKRGQDILLDFLTRDIEEK